MFRRLSKRRRNARSRTVQLQQLEPRQLLAAAPMGAIWKDTGEFLLGKVAVTPVFFESNGGQDVQTQNWTPAEIQQSLSKVTSGVQWWSDVLDTLNTVHELDFVFDTTFATSPFSTSYEPIDRPSGDHNLYLAEFLGAQGFGNESSIENAMWRFNDAQREKLQADWAFTVFVVDASDDPDGFFPTGGFPAAFALPGGLYMVVPSERSASTYAHEMGHIFWAFDEYPEGASWHARRGYYDVQNLNAAEDNPNIFNQQISIMRGGAPLAEAFNSHTSPASTLAHVGWQDSDGDGVFDVLDVPLDLDAVGYFDNATSQYHFAGSAAAVPLHNRNSYGEHVATIGTNSDITLNRISELQYRLDDGPWTVAAAPNQQHVDFDITLDISESFDVIRWRAIDQSTGIVSELVQGTSTSPAIPVSSQTGIAFIDGNDDGIRGGSEAVLAATKVTIRHHDGSPLFGGVVNAADFDGPLPDLEGVSVTVEAPPTAIGPMLDPQLRSLNSVSAGNRHVFHAQEFTVNNEGGVEEGAVRDRWATREFVARFDQPVGEVRLDAIGLNTTSYGRLEAYDASGNLVARTTSEIPFRDLVTLTVNDRAASISSIRAFGLAHSETGIAISRLEFGFTDTVVTDASGGWRVENLPDGQYIAQLTPERLIHQFSQPVVNLQVSGGTSEMVSAAARRVDSPRHNTAIAEDANQDGVVTARDALVIINDLARNDVRILGPDETDGLDIDVNNDGSATAIDALLVINFLNKSQSAQGESTASDAALVLDFDPAANDRAMAQWSGVSTPTDDPVSQIAAASVAGRMAGTVTEMWDSAGRAIPVESNAQLNADTSNQPILAPDPTPSEPGFARPDRPLTPEKIKKIRENEGNAEELALTFQSITSDLSEPLGS